MNASTAVDQDLLRCPRCGASVSDAGAGYCACCGSSLGMGGRSANGTRAPLRMSPGLGQDPVLPSQRAPSPAQGAFQLSATGKGFAGVRQHHEFGSWMQDAPYGFSHILGIACTIALGLAFAVMALSGAIQPSKIHSDLFSALFVCVGLGLAGWGTRQLVRFLNAPRLNRIACVADERTHAYRTKYGMRTRHYATFEFEGGERLEFQVPSSVAERIVRGDCGVAITRDVFLLAFHRTGPG
jgi:ribosomal protein L37E